LQKPPFIYPVHWAVLSWKSINGVWTSFRVSAASNWVTLFKCSCMHERYILTLEINFDFLSFFHTIVILLSLLLKTINIGNVKEVQSYSASPFWSNNYLYTDVVNYVAMVLIKHATTEHCCSVGISMFRKSQFWSWLLMPAILTSFFSLFVLSPSTQILGYVKWDHGLLFLYPFWINYDNHPHVWCHIMRSDYKWCERLYKFIGKKVIATKN
jgi:hypothetical protein